MCEFYLLYITYLHTKDKITTIHFTICMFLCYCLSICAKKNKNIFTFNVCAGLNLLYENAYVEITP